jgi:CRISPR-associated protein Cas1
MSLQQKHFDKDMNFAYLMEEGRKIVVKAIDEKLNTTIMHKQLKQQVSYQRIIRLELYKLVKHVLGEEPYSSFKNLVVTYVCDCGL